MSDKSKSAFSSKTIWFNLATGAVAVAGVLPEPYSAVVAAVGNIILRVWFTSQPVHVGGDGR